MRTYLLKGKKGRKCKNISKENVDNENQLVGGRGLREVLAAGERHWVFCDKKISCLLQTVIFLAGYQS